MTLRRQLQVLLEEAFRLDEAGSDSSVIWYEVERVQREIDRVDCAVSEAGPPCPMEDRNDGQAQVSHHDR